MQDAMRVFDRRTVRLHRDRAAAAGAGRDVLVREVAERLVDRLHDVRRNFPLALELGCRGGTLSRALDSSSKTGRLVQCDLSYAMARSASGIRVVADEEALPFAAHSFDLVLSGLSLHWVNDLPGTLLQVRQVLRPDGLFLAAMWGGETLKELRRVLAEAEISLEGGLSPRISPFADVRDLGNLLQRAGFALPVADAETLTVSYADPLELLADLRGMGETNAVLLRRKSLGRRQTLYDAMARYRATFGDATGRVPATFQIIFMTAWAPDPSQPQALKPGSAAARLAKALGTEEISAGERARP